MEDTKVNDSRHSSLVNELVEGRDLTKKLHQLIGTGTELYSSNEKIGIVTGSILACFERSLQILKNDSMMNQDSHNSCIENQDSDDDIDNPQKHKDNLTKRKRNASPGVKHKVQGSTSCGLEEPIDDGYIWRKYGQKEMLGAKYPRLYYRCTNQKNLGCSAKKQVQRSDEDPSIFEVLYQGKHTCSQAPSSPSPFPSNPTLKILPGLETLPCHPFAHPPQNIMWNFQKDDNVMDIKPIINNIGENLSESTSFTFASSVKTLVDHQQTPNISCKEEVVDDASFSANTHKSQPSFQDSNQDSGVDHYSQRVKDFIQSSSTFATSSASASQLSFDHQEDTGGTSKAQPYNSSMGNTDDYGAVSGVVTTSTGKSSFAIERNPCVSPAEGTFIPDMGEFNNANNEFWNIKVGKPLQYIPLHIGQVMDSQVIRPYGRAIVDKCSGLPLVIKVVEGALINTSASLDEVRKLLSTKTLHQVLKYGFDKLEDYERKSCFLYSALYTANKEVSVAYLVDSMIDEGLITGSLADARRKGYEIIQHLIHVSFLQGTNDGLIVKVHDLICDMALEILSDIQGSRMLSSRYLSSEEILLVHSNYSSSGQPDCSERTSPSPSGQLWILKAGECLIESPEEEEWEEAKIVVLMDNKLSSLPKRPTCSKLLTLFLQRNRCLRVIPPNFFENMSSLQILNLSKTRIKSLPQSVSNLGGLQVLILRNCERLLNLPSEIGALKHLLVLDVHGTEICQLPDEIGELPLVHLQVCFYGSMDQDEITMLPSQFISKGFFSRLSGLRELSIIIYPGDPRWTDMATDVTREMSNLKLCSLSFHFPEIKHLEHFVNVSPAWLHQTLTRFNLIVGHDVKRLVSHVSAELEQDYNRHDRCIRFVDGERIPKAYDGIWKVLSRATAFYLDHHLTAHTLTEFGLAAINDLKLCIVRDCPKLKVIIDSQEMTEKCFPFLEFLSIHYSWNLSHIWEGPIQVGSLAMLRQLSVHCCPKLEFILSHTMLAALINLEELVIEDCQSLKYVIGKEELLSVDDHTSDLYSTEGDVADLNAIIDHLDSSVLGIKILKLHYLPKLENIWNDKGDLPCLENISVYSCPKLKNLNFKTEIEATIKKIKRETIWWNDLKWDDPALPDKLEHCVEELNGDDIWGTM